MTPARSRGGRPPAADPVASRRVVAYPSRATFDALERMARTRESSPGVVAAQLLDELVDATERLERRQGRARTLEAPTPRAQPVYRLAPRVAPRDFAALGDTNGWPSASAAVQALTTRCAEDPERMGEPDEWLVVEDRAE